MARIPPLPKADWSPEMRELVDGFRSAVRGGAPDDGRQSGDNLLGTFARYPALAQAFLAFNGHLLYGSTLTVRQRELLILRVAAVRECDYEWAQHAIMAERAGITEEEVQRVAENPGSPEWEPAERGLLAAAGELLAEGTITETTWTELTTAFDERQCMDIVFTVGTYGTVAMLLRSLGIEPEEQLRPYLPGNLPGTD